MHLPIELGFMFGPKLRIMIFKPAIKVFHVEISWDIGTFIAPGVYTSIPK